MIVKDADKLVGLMKYRGYGQRELAALVGWKSHTILGRIMRGEQRSLDPVRATKIALILGVSVEELFLTKMSSNPGILRSTSGQAA